MMKVDITLIENSKASKYFPRQQTEIYRDPDIVVTGMDGHTSVDERCIQVRWFGHKAREMANITRVKIERTQDKHLIIESGLMPSPHDINGGVQFYLLNP